MTEYTATDAAKGHVDVIYSPEVFAEMQELLNEANGNPILALRLSISRQIRPTASEGAAIIVAIDAIRNPFSGSTLNQELLVFDAAEKWAALSRSECDVDPT